MRIKTLQDLKNALDKLTPKQLESWLAILDDSQQWTLARMLVSPPNKQAKANRLKKINFILTF